MYATDCNLWCSKQTLSKPAHCLHQQLLTVSADPVAFGNVSCPCLGANYSQTMLSSQLKNTLSFIKVLNMCFINIRAVFPSFWAEELPQPPCTGPSCTASLLKVKLRLNFEFLFIFCSFLHSVFLFVGTGARVQFHFRGVRFPVLLSIVLWFTIVLRLSDTSPGSQETHCHNQLHCSRQLQHFQPGCLAFLHNTVIFSSLSKICMTGSQFFPYKPNLIYTKGSCCF